MSTNNQALIERLLRAFEEKNIDKTLACFAKDALLFDPHYPEPVMQGKDAIKQGLNFAFGMLKQPGFTIRNAWSTAASGAVEVDTHHILADGTEVHFPQAFIYEIRGSHFTRVQAYVPYPPPAAEQT